MFDKVSKIYFIKQENVWESRKGLVIYWRHSQIYITKLKTCALFDLYIKNQNISLSGDRSARPLALVLRGNKTQAAYILENIPFQNNLKTVREGMGMVGEKDENIRAYFSATLGKEIFCYLLLQLAPASWMLPL